VIAVEVPALQTIKPFIRDKKGVQCNDNPKMGCEVLSAHMCCISHLIQGTLQGCTLRRIKESLKAPNNAIWGAQP